MLCPSCKSEHNKVIDSRVTEGKSAIRRRRVCLACRRRFTTKERLEQEVRLTVVKADGRRVPYNRANIYNGVERACYKLEISDEKMQEVVDAIEGDLFGSYERQVGTDDIGRCVGRHLRRLNPVAYVRFMSVHRKYRTVGEFIDEIRDVRVRVSRESPNQQSLFET
ncbi:MAG: transcriptional regulator NrdR [Planctomycetota bacterium]|jgi:transcriptional repressor NrdR